MFATSSRWLIVAASTLLALLLAELGLALLQTRDLRDRRLEQLHSHEMLLALERLVSLLKDAETGQRGYAITGEQRFLQPFDEAASRIAGQLDAVARLGAGDAERQQALPVLRAEVAARLAWLQEAIDARRTSGLEAALARESEGTGKALMDDLRARIDQLSTHEQALLARRSAMADRTYAASQRNTLLGGLVLTSLALLLFVLHGRQQRASGAATRTIAEQAERLRTTLASIGDAVIATDAEGRITQLNAVAEALTGWSRDAALGQPLDAVFRIVNEETRAPVENPALRALREGTVVGLANHTVLIGRDGSERPIDDSAAPIRCAQGELVGCVLVFHDVSERRATELRILRSQQQLRLVTDRAPVLIAQLDAERRYRFVNLPYAALLAKQPRDIVGRTMAEVLGAAYASAAPHAEAALAGQDVEYELELPGDARHGPRWLRVAYAPERDDAGNVRGFIAAISDISARKRAEERLRASEALFASVIRQLPLALGVTDAQGQWINTNALMEASVPRAIPSRLPERMPRWRVFDAEGRVVPREQWAGARALRGELVSNLEALYTQDDGSQRWKRLGAAPLRDAAGAISGAIVVMEDITEHKQTQDALRAAHAGLELRVAERTAELARANRFMAALLESVADGIVACDAEGRLSLFNRTTREWHGLPQEALPAGEWAGHYSLYRDDGTTPMQPHEVPLARAYAGEQVRDARMVIAPRHGPKRILLASGQPFHDDAGRLLGAVVSMHDVTQQLAAEQAARAAHELLEERVEQRTAELATANALLRAQAGEREQAERAAATAAARLELISDTVPALISYIDRERRYRLNNRAYETWFGHARGAVTGRHVREVLGDAAWAIVGPRIDAAFAGQVETYEAEVPYRDGGTRWISATYSPSRGAGGDVDGVVVLVIDISESKRIERALQEADRRKDEFLATLAHELRNPLAPLRNGLQVLRLGAGDAQTAQVRAMMERQLAHMVRLLDDLLDVSRISRGSIVLRRERVQLADMLRHAVEVCTPMIEERGHALALALPEEHAALDADPARLSQAVCNLLTNAARYTEPGGRIALEAGIEGGVARVSVADNGSGIDAERLPRVFDMFTHSTGQQGLGIGLSIVKKLVELHGGTIEAKSDGPGHGSTFVMRLPVAGHAADAADDARSGSAASPACASQPAPDGAPAGAGAQPAPAAAGLRVLVVDDNRDAADSLALMLGQMGHATRVAYSGAHALDEAGTFRPEVVFMDIGMPGLSGHDVAERLRKAPWATKLRLVAVTGWGQAEDRRRSADSGFDVHLVKPVDPAALEEALRSA